MSNFKPISVGTVVYKKVVVGTEEKLCTCGCGSMIDQYIYGIATLEVVEPGFICRVESGNRKGRVAAAKVISIVNMDTDDEVTEAKSYYNGKFKYAVGETVRPEVEFNTDTSYTCTSGIHCFLNREDAENYEF